MKHYLLHLRAPIRALFALLAFSAVSLSVEAQAQETSCYVVFSNTKDFQTKVEVPMVAALYRDDKGGNTHTQDNSRWQISLKYDDPRWKDISDGTVYWYIKTSGGGYYRSEQQWRGYGRWQRQQCYDCLCPRPHVL